jgi:signal transduction histidine kinase
MEAAPHFGPSPTRAHQRFGGGLPASGEGVEHVTLAVVAPLRSASLIRRLGSLLLLAFGLTALETAAMLIAVRRQEADSRLVNLAGRQRMLTQAMTRDALQASRGDVVRGRALLVAKETFARSLQTLREGDPARATPPPSTAGAAALRDVATEWEPFATAVERVAALPAGDPEREEALAYVVSHSDALLERAEAATTIFDEEAHGRNQALAAFGFAALVVAVAVFGVTLLRVRRLVQPLREVAASARGIAAGEHRTSLAVPDTRDEVADVARAIRDLALGLATQQRRQAAQHAATRVLAEATSLGEAMPNILKAICESLGWQWSATWTIDRERGVLRCGEMWHAVGAHLADFSACSQATTFAEGIGLPGRVWESGQAAWIRDVQVDPNFPRAPVARTVGLHAAFCFPLKSAHGLLGVMEFLSTEVSEPDTDLLAMMDAIGSQIGQFVERRLAEESSVQKAKDLARAHAQLEREFADRTESGRRLATQHAVTRILADSPSLADATPQVLRAVCASLGWAWSAMWHVDADADVLRHADDWSADQVQRSEFEALSRTMTFSRGLGLPGRVWSSRTPAWIPDVQVDPNFPRASAARAAGLFGAFAFPILLEHRVLAVMEFFAPSVRDPDEALLAMLAAIGSQMGQFIKRRDAERHLLARTEQVRLKNDELREALERMKAMQAHVIVQEKLASLGSLTAGIAHEIKNPLNFVINFADLSAELSAELGHELAGVRTSLDPDRVAALDGLIDDISDNVSKIGEHGRRADRVVQGMLAHSRGTGGERRRVDLNRLVTESASLASRDGLPARADAGLNIDVRLDDAVDSVDAVPDDLRRVVKNLVDNAVYAALHHRARAAPPEVRVTTRLREDHRIEIRVRDNGGGVAPEVRDKMFAPFFTTKPPGEGTGLGLSISREIVVQGYGGAIEVETEEGQFTELVVVLPQSA